MKNTLLQELFYLKSAKKLFLTLGNMFVFLFFFSFGSVAAGSYSQTVQITIQGRQIPLEEVFSRIEKQSEYLFFYVDNDVKGIKVDMNAKNQPVREVLNQALGGTNLSFLIKDRHINIFRKETANRQKKRQLTGVVTDNKGETIIGATIQVVGESGGTVTDIDGKFSLAVADDVKQLTCTYIGYEKKVISVADKSFFKIVLSENNVALDEVVVTGYGGTQLRSKLTNSIANVDNEQLSVGLFSNPAQALSGAVSGLRVIQSSGNPSAAPAIVLRGGTNLDGTGSPLILVDGQQRESMSDINPEDIESIDVLKDAGATALYGARANNGVVLITTKRGKQGHTSISLKAKVGFNYMNSPYDFMEAGDYLYYMRTSIQRSSQIFQTADGRWVGTTNMGSLKGAEAYGTGNIYWADAAKTKPADGNKDSRAFWSPMIYTPDLSFLLKQGWQTMRDPVYGDEIIYKNWDMGKANIQSPAVSQDYNLSISGGNDRGNYYAGLGYNHTEGLPLGNFYKRLSAMFNGEYKIKDWLTSYTNFSLVNSKYNGLPNGRESNARQEDIYFTSMLSAPPTMRGYNANGELLLGDDVENGSMAVNIDKFLRDNNNDKITFGQSLKMDYKKFSLKLSGIWMYDEGMKEHFDKDYLTWSDEWNRARESSAEYGKTYKQTYNAVLTYGNTFKNHSVDVLAGFEYYDEYTKGFSAAGSGAPTDDFSDLELTSTGEKKRTIDSWHERQRIMSFFGRFNYDYKGKYLLSATLRRDGYSILLGANRWGTFPGVSAGWLMSKEPFMQSLRDVVSFAKLRASYGLNGNVSNISGENVKNGAYDLQGAFTTDNYGGDVGYLLSKIPNPQLRWEKSHTFEAGLDLSFLENRINTNFTFYNRVTQDKYANIPLPGSSGLTSFRTNNGEIRNRGFEFELGFKVIRSKDWNLDVNVNGAYNKNTILKLPDNGLERNRQNAYQVYNPKTGDLMWVGGYQEGQEPGVFYSFQAEGIYRSYDEIPGNLIDKTSGNNGSNGLVLYGPEAWAKLPESEKVKANGNAAALPIQPGDVKWKDVNGDGVIDNYDMVKMGNRMPHWTGGINATLSYKNFTFYTRMDYALDFKISDGRTAWFMGNMVGYYNTLNKSKDTWSPENPGGKYPTYTWADQLEKRNYARNSSMFVYNGSYLAFREVSLSYNFPKNWIEKLRIQKLELNVTGQNLGYLTAAKNAFSPEVSAETVDFPRNGGYPLPRTVVFGVNLTF